MRITGHEDWALKGSFSFGLSKLQAMRVTLAKMLLGALVGHLPGMRRDPGVVATG